MKMHQIYCGACDRPVRVMIADAPPSDGQATLHDEEVVCLEIGEQCNGSCPIGATEPNAMVSRRVRSGLPLEGMRTVDALCPACGLESEMVLYGQGRAACTSCGSPARWTLEHVEPF